MALTATAFAWQGRAACRGQEHLFFGPDTETEADRLERESAAKAICAACPARRDCLDYALAVPPADGVWGGLNHPELRKWRRAELRRRRQVAA